ncbi:MAG: peptidoglycan DD-metalloendopeptidase family protein [Alphaproteobacteria bacterium]
MGENGFRRHLRAAAAVSLAAFAASCGAGRHEAAPVILNGAGTDRVETAPVPAIPVPPKTAAPRRPPPPSGAGKRIVVRPGQSVGYLAREYGVSKQAVIDANKLTPPEYKIEIGQTLVIPGGGPGSSPGGEARPTAVAATTGAAEKPSAPPPERTAAASRAGKTPEIIPLDEPAPAKSAEAPRKSAEAPAISFPPPAASARGKLSPPAAEPARPPAESVEKEVAAAEAEPPAKSGGPFPWPVRGRILAGYGATKGGGNNAGINIAAARGTPVRAVDSGVVAYAGNEIRGYGNLVLVKHSSGFISAYAHLDELLVKRGDSIGRGQVIAKVGTTGGVSEPQLHFELRRGKKAVDPREFLGSATSAESAENGKRG